MFIRAEEVIPFRVVYQSESISPGINVLIGDNTVTNDINISLDLRLLQKADESLELQARRDATTHRLGVSLKPVQVWSLEHKVPDFPRSIMVALLAHPTIMIWRADLRHDRLT